MLLGSVKFKDLVFDVKVYNNQKLGNKVALDTETTLAPFHMTPKLVTFQAFDGECVYYVPKSKIEQFFNINNDNTFVLQNFSFDFDVTAKHLESHSTFYKIMDENRVQDTAILYRLLHLAAIGFVPPQYNLKLLSKKFLNFDLDKELQTEWTPYLNTPLNQIPRDMLEYGALDVIVTYYLHSELRSKIVPYDTMNTLLSHDIQIKGEWALNQIFKHGIGFDLERRDALLKEMNQKLEDEALILDLYGWRRGLKGMKSRFDQICDMYGINVPFTEDGSRSSKKEDLEKYQGNQFVDAYLMYHEIEKATTFIRNIESNRIHPRYNSLVNTGRTSCSGGKAAVNIQQIPRIGGIREMFIPESGKVFVDIDYSALELAGLAQVCISKYGYSKMGDLINEGKCLHYYTASNVYRKPESQVTKDERQFAKIPNFAFPTNMGASTFVDYCKGYKVPMTEAQAQELKDAYAMSYPEISEQFWKVPHGQDVVTTLTGRVRSNCTYTAYLNTQFQGLCADGAKLALYDVTKAGYKIVAFIHDQIMVEVDEERADHTLEEVSNLMVNAMQTVIPDVKITVEGEILKRWKK